MVKRAIESLQTIFPGFTRVHFIMMRVVSDLFPPMALAAFQSIRASFAIEMQILSLFPVRALYGLQLNLIRTPSQILPIMGIDTTTPVMGNVRVRAKLSLVVEHKKV